MGVANPGLDLDRYDGVFTSVGEILKREGLAQVSPQFNVSKKLRLSFAIFLQYEPCNPVTLDLAIPPESSIRSVCINTPNKLPPIPFFSNQDEKSEDVYKPMGKTTCLDSEDWTCDDSYSEKKAPPLALQERTAVALEEHTPFSPPPPTPPLDSADDKTDGEDAIEKAEGIPPGSSSVRSPTPLRPRPDSSLPPVAVEDAEGTTVVSTTAAKTEEEEAENCSHEFLIGKDSSGSSLSDNDWLDEDLLPRRYELLVCVCVGRDDDP